MVRLAVASLMIFAAHLLSVPQGHAQGAGEVWEPAGPVSTSQGMTAVASDPEHPGVVWIGSASSVWVSEDDGQTFDLVLQLSRTAGVREDNTDPEDSEDLPDGNDPEDIEDLPDGVTDIDDVDPDDIAVDNGDNTEGPAADDTVTDDSDDALVARFGVVRLRVSGDLVYVCTNSGLYTIERSARRIGTEREVRFGRKVPVNDVAVTPDKRVWIATDSGLLELGAIDSGGLGRPARGFEEDLAVSTVIVSEARLIAATSRGLRIATPTNDGFERLAIGGRDDIGLEDILLEADGRILVAGANQVSRILVRIGSVPTVEETWNVPGAARLAHGRNNTRWAVGERGAWRWKSEQGFERITDGLFDRRLRDVATGFGTKASMWSVGRSGAWRLVTDAGRAYSASAERLAKTALEGYPDDAKVLRWAIDALPMTLDKIDGWALQERLSWLLPTVEIRWRWDRRRAEDFIGVPQLDGRVLDAVGVRPVGDDFRFMVYWNVMPAIVASLETAEPIYETSRIRARRQLERVREVVMPLYQTWAKKRIDFAASEELSLREALRDLLAIQRLESDLRVYTEGRFPVEGVSKKPTALN